MGRKVATVALGIACAVAGLVAISAESAIAATPGSPVGAFTDVSARFDDGNVLTGFAYDPDVPTQSIAVHLYVGATLIGTTVTTVPPGSSRPLVWTFDTSTVHFSTNPTACAYAINVGPGANALLGCHPIKPSGASPSNPRGSLDFVGVAPGLIQMRGWAGDPDGDRTTKLRIYYGSQLMVQKTADLPRPDVQRVFPALGPTTGFNFTLPILPGPRQVCVYAQNTGLHGSQNSTVGCVTRTVPGVQPPGPHDPRGAIDHVFVTSFGPPRYYTFGADGWVYDPDSAGPARVFIRSFIERGVNDPEDIYQTATLRNGKPRPDVQHAVPAAGPNAGFDGGIASSLYVWPTYSCAYGVNVGPGASRFLGCWIEYLSPVGPPRG